MKSKLIALILCLMQAGFAMERTQNNSQVSAIVLQLEEKINAANEIINQYPKSYEYERLKTRVSNNQPLDQQEINNYKNQLSRMKSAYNSISDNQKELLLKFISEKYKSDEFKAYVENLKNRIDPEYHDSLKSTKLQTMAEATLNIDFLDLDVGGKNGSRSYLQQNGITNIGDKILFLAFSECINPHSYWRIVNELNNLVIQLYKDNIYKDNKNRNNEPTLLFAKKLLDVMNLYNEFCTFLKTFLGESFDAIKKAEIVKSNLKDNIAPLSEALSNIH